jgi:hypothetical protein
MNIELTRRYFILTATSAAGGLMIGIGAARDAKPRPSSRSPGTKTTPTPPTRSTRGSPSIPTIPS